MSFDMMRFVIDKSRDEEPILSKGCTYEYIVLLMLADCLNKKTGRCNPSLTSIARYTLLSRNSVIKSLKALEEKGLIEVKRENNRSNSYQILPGLTLPQTTTDHFAKAKSSTNEENYYAANKRNYQPPKLSAVESVRARTEEARHQYAATL